jgi:hypothetical protein
VGKLIYLIVLCLASLFTIGIVSQSRQSPRQQNWNAVCCILWYLKGASDKGLGLKTWTILILLPFQMQIRLGDPLDRRSVSGVCSFVEGNLAT